MPLMPAAALASAAAKPVRQPRDQVRSLPMVDGAAPRSVHRLDQMAPARQIIAVLHMEGGCPRPTVVREMVGQSAKP